MVGLICCVVSILIHAVEHCLNAGNTKDFCREMCESIGLTFLSLVAAFWSPTAQLLCARCILRLGNQGLGSLWKRVGKIGQTLPFGKKTMGHPAWKAPLLLDMKLSFRRERHSYFKYHMKDNMLLIYRVTWRMFSFLEWIAVLKALRWVAVLTLCLAITDAYNMEIVLFCSSR